MHKISKVFRSDSDPNGLLVCNRLLSATHTEHALERNQLVLVVNKANGRKVHLAVRGLDKLKQNEVKVDYDSAKLLGIDMRETYRKTKRHEAVEVDLEIRKASILHHCFSSLNSHNTLERSSARIAAIGIINLAYTVTLDAIKFAKYLVELLL